MFFREANPPGVGGKIFQMSSIVGAQGLPGMAHYSASKFGMSLLSPLLGFASTDDGGELEAVEALSEALAAEIDPAWNIKVSCMLEQENQGTSVSPPHRSPSLSRGPSQQADTAERPGHPRTRRTPTKHCQTSPCVPTGPTSPLQATRRRRWRPCIGSPSLTILRYTSPSARTHSRW